MDHEFKVGDYVLTKIYGKLELVEILRYDEDGNYTITLRNKNFATVWGHRHFSALESSLISIETDFEKIMFDIETKSD